MINKAKLLTRLGPLTLDSEIMLCENNPDATPRRIEDIVFMEDGAGKMVAVLLMEPSPCRCHELKDSKPPHEVPREPHSVPE